MTEPTRKVPTRRISFDEALREVPRHFTGDLITSHVVVALSSVFPDGEDFFVRSVRRYRDRIEDPELKRQVAGFIGQEAMHGREHRAFNDRLAELGYPTKRTERIVKRFLAFRERVFSGEVNLATTAALEHFTATLAEMVLSSDEARQMFGDDAVRSLFLWHALEESEHKAVAFDVYRAIGGSERTRRVTMTMLRYGFVIGVTVQVLLTLATDRATYKPGVLRASWRRFRRSPVMQRELWEQLKAYNRFGFHPDDRDTNALVERWRGELFGPDGSLTPLLSA